jgi:Uma2 family endonuclease
MADLAQEKLYTVEEFFNYTTGRDEDKLFELVRGEIREVAGSVGKNTAMAMEVGRHVGNFVKPRKLGFVTGADGSYVLHKNFPDTVRIPDVGFISIARLPKLPDDSFIPIPPDLAIEVVSKSESGDDIREKIEDYLEHGVRMIWIIYPRTRLVDVYTQEHPAAVPHKLNDILDGGDVLPGFTLAVKDIFEV